jgi:regulator of sigma E protease
MGVFVQVSQFILSLSILIILHEAGHFTAARIFKIKVEKFYLFFDPWFSLFKYKKGDTEYGIGWLPLGGYVKIAGMVDESMDKEQMKLPPQPWEFRAKPGWQRLIVMVSGVTVNFLLGFIIFTSLVYKNGTSYLPIKNIKYGIYCDSLATKVGLRNTDTIVGVNGKTITRFDSVMQDIIFEKAQSIQVKREGKMVNLPISQENLAAILGDLKGFIEPLYSLSIDSVLPGSIAEKAGLKKGDHIAKIDTVATYFQTTIATFQKFKNKDVLLSIVSNGNIHTVPIHVSDSGKIGIAFLPDTLQLVHAKYTLLESIPVGVHNTFGTIGKLAKQLNILFTVKGASKQLGGFYSIGKSYSKVWDWGLFWALTAFISVMLAFINILPIPALDGGHVMFLLYEMLTGRKPNEKVMEYAQLAGMVLLLTLMVYANGLDIGRIFHK